jgi:hypothetical protein
MEYFASPEMILQQVHIEQARTLRQSALCIEACRPVTPRSGVRHAVAEAFRELALRIDSEPPAPDVPGVVTQG